MRSLALLSLSTALALGQNDDNRSTLSSCAQISRLFGPAYENNELPLIVDSQLAIDCLSSMPFDAERARNFTIEVRKYMEFQSTLEALKNPPDTYMPDSVDIIGGLKEISEKEFSNHFDFDHELQSLVASAKDGHFSLSLCSHDIFAFFTRSNRGGLVSVSEDGVKKPEVWLYADAEDFKNGTENVSPVARINNMDVNTYLEEFASEVTYADPDTRWNWAFASNIVSKIPTGGFINDGQWHGSHNTTIEFKNGSTTILPRSAELMKDSFWTTGQSNYEAFCLPQRNAVIGGGNNQVVSQNSPAEVESPEPPVIVESPAKYPKPFVGDPYNQILGYEVDDDAVAMLIPSFDGVGLPQNQSVIFWDTAMEIIQHAKQNGRTKMIIDVSGNGGGDIDRAFNLFKVFFPDEFPYSGTRFRRSEQTELLAKMFSGVNATEAREKIYPLAYQGDVRPDQEDDIESLEDFLGDEEQLGVKVSSMFANFNYTHLSTKDQHPILGFGEVTNELSKTAPFDSENIIIISDGACSSTCTTFTNLMTNVGGVRTVAFGGRPRTEPMQIMGGVRGAQFVPYALIRGWVEVAFGFMKTSIEAGQPLLSKDEFERANEQLPLPLDRMPFQLPAGGVNFRNAYQEGNEDLPLQFDYQASDCRLFYTFENIENPGSVWGAAAGAIWGDQECVKNSTGGRGSQAFKEKGGKSSEQPDTDEENGIEDSDDSSARALKASNGLLILAMFSSLLLLS